MTLAAGMKLGPYEILAPLGVGGMGEVYRGRDTRLGRDVAIKVLPAEFSADAARLKRFEQEARSASALNHPNIITIYEIETVDATTFLVMELIDGKTLRELLLTGPLPTRQVLEIGGQVADGLAKAHASGIVHRDLKPENIMITRDGFAKILDFGLAKFERPGGETAESVADTLSQTGTTEGTVLGTIGYMSPEQATGTAADFRSDQFSLGAILYEMATGERAFRKKSAIETLSAILRDEPEPIALRNADTPAHLQWIVDRCLSKDPEQRYGSTRDLARDLRQLDHAGGLPSGTAPLHGQPARISPPNTPTAEAPSPRIRARRVLALVAALAAALAAAAWIRFHASTRAIDSLAVLPFENASKDSAAEYLGDGLTENLISQMSRVPSLKVMARATVFRFKGTADPQEAGRKLGVGAVLAGSVERRGNQLSISAELIEIATGARLWGEKYDRPFADLLPVQDSIAMDISDALRLRLSGREKRALSRHGTENPEAYELSLKARFFLLRDTEEDDLEARRLYLQAVEKDPRFADAHVGVATTYSRSAVSGYAPPAEAWPRADEEVRKALELDPGNVLARCALAHRRFFFDWDWTSTEREYRELSTDSRVFLGEQFRPIGLSLWARGRTEEAVALMEKALRVDPGNLVSRLMMGNFLAQAGRLEEAIGCYRAAVEAEPSDPRPLFGLAEVLRRRRDAKGAIDARRKAYELSGEEDGAKALVAARTEKDYESAEAAVARFRLDDLEARARERYVSPLDLARLQAQVGEREKAFASLEAALAERSAGLVFLKVEQAWDRIRDDARFASLVRRVGIP